MAKTKYTPEEHGKMAANLVGRLPRPEILALFTQRHIAWELDPASKLAELAIASVPQPEPVDRRLFGESLRSY